MKLSRMFVCLAGVALSTFASGCADVPDEETGNLDNALGAGSTATADTTNVYYRVPFSAAPKWLRIFLDTDRNASSGFRGYGIGAEYLFENGNLYRYSGAAGAWGWTRIKSVPYTVGSTSAKVTIARADLGSPAGIDLVTQTDPPVQTSPKITQSLAGSVTPPAPPSTGPGPAPGGTGTGAGTVTGPAYYVSPSGNDGNSGTQASPWRTIQKAADSVVAGDTIVLMDGAYEEREIVFRKSGTAAKPITVRAQNKWKAISSSISGCSPAFSIYASYIKVKDILFAMSPSNAQCSTYTSSNVAIRAWSSTQATPSSPSTGYEGFGADGVKVAVGLNRSEAIKSNQDFTVIENTESDNAIELFGSRDSVIRNSIVTGQDMYGVSLFAKGGVRNAQIYNNVVRNKVSNGYAIIVGGYSCDTCFFDPSAKIEAYNTVAYDNVVINESGGTLWGLVFQGAKDSAFFNNVLVGGMLTLLPGGHNTGFQFPTTNPTFKNNILACNGSSAITGTSAGTMSLDYNDFFNCGGAPSQAHSIVGDPRFVNATSDWHLQAGSPALNTGTPVTFAAYGGGTIDVSRDRDGVVRSTPWDLGVYEQ